MTLPRRRLLGLAAGGALVGLVGCADTGAPAGESWSEPWRREQASCVPRSALDRRTAIAGAELVYEIDERRSAFWFETGFHEQLGRWLPDFVARSGTATPDVVRTYGSWIDGGDRCDSWHHNGRAFDLASLRRGDRTLVSCR